MSTREAFLVVLEQALNRYLALDPGVLERMGPLHGKRIALQLRGLDNGICLIPGPDGIQVYASDMDGGADCVLRGTPMGFARMGRGEASRELFGGAVEIRGDSDLAQAFGELPRGLDIDWEEQISRYTGDLLAHQIGRGLRGAGAWGLEASATLTKDLGEYLREEARLLPCRDEARDFASDIDVLRDDMDRLEARIKRLGDRLAATREAP